MSTTSIDQITIKSIKARGSLNLSPTSCRFLRLSCGKLLYRSPTPATLQFCSPSTLLFPDINLHIRRQTVNNSDIQLQIFEKHTFAQNQYQLQLHAAVSFENLRVFRGEYMELDLLDVSNEVVGTVTLVMEAFQKYRGFMQKISSEGMMEKPRRSLEVGAMSPKRSNNIKQIMTQNLLSNKLMTISSVVLRSGYEDKEITGNQCFLLIRYGKLKSYTKPIRKFKDQLMWQDYLEFVMDDNMRFEFFLLYLTPIQQIICRAKGQIKYIVFDETITAHTVILNDRRRQVYGNLSIKFAQITVNQAKGSTKPQKRIKDMQDKIPPAIDEFNKDYFDGKYQGHLLSQNLREQQLKQLEEEQKMRPLNPQQIKIRQQNKKFVEFLQKELIKFDKEIEKQDKVKKTRNYLPLVMPKTTRNSSRNYELNSSVVTLPKI